MIWGFNLLKIFCGLGLILILFAYSYFDYQNNYSFSVDEIKNAKKVIGTPERSEREYKFSLSKVNESLLPSINEALGTVGKKCLNIAYAKITQTELPKLETTSNPMIFLDIYFDNDEKINYNNSISYRFRQRWINRYSYIRFSRGSSASFDLPTRAELQVKTDRSDSLSGFSIASEARFEFREDSDPFNKYQLPVSAPWSWQFINRLARTGKYLGAVTTSAQHYANNISKISRDKFISLKPVLVSLTERYRNHLKIKSSYGGGANPDDLIVMTLDAKYGFKDIKSFLSFERQTIDHILDFKFENFVVYLGAEIEIEFERNISTQYDKLSESERKNIGFDFNQAHHKFSNCVLTSFKKESLKITPLNISKYKQLYNKLVLKNEF